MKWALVLAVAFSLVGSVSAEDKPEKKPEYHPVDLQEYFNQKRGDNMGTGVKGNNLARLPGGEQVFGDVKFQVGDGVIQLGSSVIMDPPEKVAGIKVDRKCAQLHVLHATCFGGGPNRPGNPWFVKDGTTIGEYRVNYEDQATVNIPIVYGEDVRDWFYVGGEMETARGKVVWKGENDRAAEVGAKIRLYMTTWKNPHPDKKVASIDYVGKKPDTVAAPFCVAITLE